MTTSRSDIHRPTEIRPEDYSYLESWDLQMPLHTSDKYMRGLFERAENSSADHSDVLSQCDHCGAHLRYIALWEHKPTGDVIVTGETCARETMEVPDRLILDQKRLRETAAARRAAVRESDEIQKRREEMRERYPEAVEILWDYQGENIFIQDVAARFGKKGYLSQRQADTVVYAHKRDLDRAKRNVADEPKVPAPEGNGIEITGKVLKVASQDNGWNVREVMTVLDERGFKVWGTVPSSIHWVEEDGDRRPIQRGDLVTFVANVTRSDRDESFGFFKRPRNAYLVDELHD